MEKTEETAVTLWVIGWVSSFPIAIFAENHLAWMAAASVSLGLMANGLRHARLRARPVGREVPLRRHD